MNIKVQYKNMIKNLSVLCCMLFQITIEESFCQNESDIFSGTCIIGYIHEDSIWVGADSRVSHLKGGHEDNVTKIIFEDSLVVAHSGVSVSKSKGFYVKRIIEATLSEYKEIKWKMFIAEERIRDHFYNWFYNQGLKDTAFPELSVGLLFAYFYENKPKIECLYFVPFIDTSGFPWVDRVRVKPVILTNGDSIYYLGIYDKIDELVKNGIFSGYANKEKTIHDLIFQQSLINEKVGGKIDVVLLTKHGVKCLY